MAKPNARNPKGNPSDREAVTIGAEFGRRLGIICDLRGIVGSALDLQIGVERGTVWSIISGRRGSRVSADLVGRLADALDVDMEWLFLGRGSKLAFARLGFIACGLSPSSPVWPKEVPRLAEAIVSDPRHDPSAHRKTPQRPETRRPLRRR